MTCPTTTRWPLAALASMLLVLLAACSTGASGSAPGPRAEASPAEEAATGDRYQIVMSLNQIGIPQRAQGVNGAEHVAATMFADTVDFEVRVSGDTVSDQVASIQQIIRSGPDALLVVASSFSALNQVLTQACDAGIVVVNFAQVADAVDCTYKRPLAVDIGGADAARFLCQELGGTGSILADQGIAGLPTAELEHNAVVETLAAECPGVTVAATYQSTYQPGPELTALSAALAVNDQIDGIFSQAYCSAAATALGRAGLGPVPLACGGVNQNAIACEEQGIPCFLQSKPSLAYPLALETAVAILDGEDVPQEAPAYLGNFALNAPIDFEHDAPVTVAVAGQDYFPDAAPELIIPVTVDDFGITPEIAVGSR